MKNVNRGTVNWALSIGLCWAGFLVTCAGRRAGEVVIVDYSREGAGGIFGDLKPPDEFIQGIWNQRDRVYEISTVLKNEDTFNGWVIEAKNAPNWAARGNWAEIGKNGRLVLRLSMGKECTKVLKLEVVTVDPDNGADNKFEVYIDLHGKANAERLDNGIWIAVPTDASAKFAAGEPIDAVVPFDLFKLTRFNVKNLQLQTVTPDFAKVRKVTLVFEEKVLRKFRQPNASVLKIHSVKASSMPEQQKAGG